MKFRIAFQELIRKWVSKSKLAPNDSMSTMDVDQVVEFCNWIIWLWLLRTLLYVAIAWVFYSIFSDIQLIICNTSMFQRSGALLVAAAALLEFGSQKRLTECSNTYNGFNETWHNGLIVFQKRGKILGIMGIIVGTLIWAYGDFIFFANCK